MQGLQIMLLTFFLEKTTLICMTHSSEFLKMFHFLVTSEFEITDHL